MCVESKIPACIVYLFLLLLAVGAAHAFSDETNALPAQTPLPEMGPQGTVEMWARPSRPLKGLDRIAYLFDSKSRDGNNYFRIRTEEKTPSIYLSIKADGQWLAPLVFRANDWGSNVWRHLAAVWTPQEIRFYVDGNLADLRRVSVPNLGSIIQEGYRIGTDFEGKNPFPGVIADVQFAAREKYTHTSGRVPCPPRSDNVVWNNGRQSAPERESRNVLPSADNGPFIMSVPSPFPPPLEGTVDKADWFFAASLSGFTDGRTGQLAPVQPQVWITHDESRLYLGINVPAGGSTNAVLAEDILEFWLVPFPDRMFHFTGTPDGRMTGEKICFQQPDAGWSGTWTYQTSTSAGGWSAVFSIVFTNLGSDLIQGETRLQKGAFAGIVLPRLVATKWLFNAALFRNNRAECYEWAPRRGQNTPAYGKLEFAGAGPAIQFEQVGIHQDRLTAALALHHSYRGISKDMVDLSFQGWRSGKQMFSKNKDYETGAKFGQILLDLDVSLLEQPLDKLVVSAVSARSGIIYRSEISLPVIPTPRLDVDYLRLDQRLYVTANLGELRDAIPGVRGRLLLLDAVSSNAVMDLPMEPDQRPVTLQKVDIKPLPEKDYIIRVLFLDSDGRTLAQREHAFHKDDMSWEKAAGLGVTEDVLPPWIPLTLDGSRVSCWGRMYAADTGPVLSSVLSQEKELLAAPIEFECTAAGAPVLLKAGPVKVVKQSAGQVILEREIKSSVLRGDIRYTIEYDGMVIIAVRFQPPQQVIDWLALRVPLAESTARLYQTFRYPDDPLAGIAKVGYGNMSGELPAKSGRIWQSAFLPYLWLGNERVGLLWCADSDEGFHVTRSKESTLRVDREQQSVVLRVVFIDRATKWDQPRQYRFGLQATPVRPLPDDWLTWRFNNQDWKPLRRKLYGLKEDQWNDIGVLWGDAYSELQGWCGVDAPEAYRAFWKRARAHEGRKMMTYLVMSGMDIRTPEGKEYEYKFACLPPGVTTPANMGKLTMFCYEGYENMFLWALDSWLTNSDIDGIYLDNVDPMPCVNPRHHCGYRTRRADSIFFDDDDEIIRPTYNIFKSREVMKRARALFVQHGKDPLIVMSSRGKFPLYAFADLTCFGEQIYYDLNRDRKNYLQSFPIERWRVEMNPLNYGNIPLLLPEIRDSRALDPAATDEFLRLTLLHGVSVWASLNCAPWPIINVWQAENEFGLNGARFLPYWEAGGAIRCEPESVKVSAYLQPKRALLVLGNLTDAEVEGRLEWKPAELGIPDNAAVTDALTGAGVTRQDHRLSVPIPANGFRLLFFK